MSAIIQSDFFDSGQVGRADSVQVGRADSVQVGRATWVIKLFYG